MKRALSKILISQHAISTILLRIDGDVAHARVLLVSDGGRHW
jgi:hypothetical protein